MANMNEEDTESAIEDLMKDQMGPQALSDAVLTLIWSDDTEGLRKLCRYQVATEIVLEKTIAKIAAGNPSNDALYLVARRIMGAAPWLQHHVASLNGKLDLVANPAGGPELLAPFRQEELSPKAFMSKVELIMGTHVLMGLDTLVSENPNLTKRFVREMVEHQGGTIDPDSRLFLLLCEMAVSYRNHRHEPELIELLEKAGGRLTLLKQDDDIAWVKVFTGGDALSGLHLKAETALDMLSSDPDAALAILEELVAQFETVLAGYNATGDYAYVNTLLFSGVLLALNGDLVGAQLRFAKCLTSLGPHGYAGLIVTNVRPLHANASSVREALSLVSSVAGHEVFGKFLEHVTGHDFSEVNEAFAEFMTTAGDREMGEAFAQSERLLRLYDARRSAVVPFSMSESVVRVFRACYFVQRGDLTRGEHECAAASNGEVLADALRPSFEKLALDPEAVLASYFGE